MGTLRMRFPFPASFENSTNRVSLAQMAKEIATITADEAHWLKLHIAGDGELDDIEKALLAFIIDESGPLPAEVAEWADAHRA